MNSIFVVSLFVIMVITFIFDHRKLKSQKKSLRWFYYGMFAITFAVYLCSISGVPLPMPTAFFLHKVSPWVYSLIQL
ncbi:hypothetical protein [Paenibacillus sp. RC67]|uniref:hypothetical protein n=1 Tax=Paenibacillus sp. RC67 TaxID=3039392 RepID=UPI0024ADDA8F|nr:hypothetical protein [Paenibacillus sp. RC67]